MEDENTDIVLKEKSDRKNLLIGQNKRTKRKENESVRKESRIVSNSLSKPFASKKQNKKSKLANQANVISALTNLKKYDTINTARELKEIEEIG